MSIITEALRRAEKEKDNPVSSKEYLNRILGPERKQVYVRNSGETGSVSEDQDADPRDPAAYFKSRRTLAIMGWLFALTIVFLTAANIFVFNFEGVNTSAREETRISATEPVTAEAYTKIRPGMEMALESADEQAASDFRLNGIVWDAGDPWAVINNKVVKSGEVIEGAEVISIKPQEVVILFRNKTFSLRVK